MGFDWTDEVDKYRTVLRPLFELPVESNLLSFSLALLRAEGTQAAGWDSHLESRSMLSDLMTLQALALPTASFPDAKRTRLRLELLSYVHLTEMDAPYHIMCSLLRVRAGQSYVINPFADLTQQRRVGAIPPSPRAKIRKLKELATSVSLAETTAVFEDFYFPELRNSISHSDYVLHDSELRMVGDLIADEHEPSCMTSRIPFERLGRIVGRAFAFYSAFFAMVRSAQRSFSSLKGRCFPFDERLKGLLEFLVDDEGELSGWKIHWPNGQDSIYQRSGQGTVAQNLALELDGSYSFCVGEFFRDHHPMTRLVPAGGSLQYTPVSGSNEGPAWPSKKFDK